MLGSNVGIELLYLVCSQIAYNHMYTAGGFEVDVEDTAWYVSGSVTTSTPSYIQVKCGKTYTQSWCMFTRHLLEGFHQTQMSITLDSHLTTVQRNWDIILYSMWPGNGIYCSAKFSTDWPVCWCHAVSCSHTLSSMQKRILHLSNLTHNLSNDPVLSSIPSHLLPPNFVHCHRLWLHISLQWYYIYETLFQHAEFITSGIIYPGSLSDCSLETHTFKLSFLAFMCLIYFTKHASAFTDTTPQSPFQCQNQRDMYVPVKAQHMKLLYRGYKE